MVNEEILGGLKAALERGQSLREAMMTFFNAGYPEQQIKEAASAIHTGHFQIEKIKPPQKYIEKTQTPINKSPAKPVQKISNYGEPKKINLKLIILIILLVFLTAGLIGVFLFYQEITNFFNSLFS